MTGAVRARARVYCSYPLVGLTQLGHYVSTLAKLGKTHEEMVFKGATGHSQGVVSAVVLASSATTAELNANALKMVSELAQPARRLLPNRLLATLRCTCFPRPDSANASANLRRARRSRTCSGKGPDARQS